MVLMVSKKRHRRRFHFSKKNAIDAMRCDALVLDAPHVLRQEPVEVSALCSSKDNFKRHTNHQTCRWVLWQQVGVLSVSITLTWQHPFNLTQSNAPKTLSSAA